MKTSCNMIVDSLDSNERVCWQRQYEIDKYVRVVQMTTMQMYIILIN